MKPRNLSVFALILVCFGGLASPASAHAAGPRGVVPFDAGWRFAFKPSGSDLASPQFKDGAWEPVMLPHTWNAFDGQDGGNNYARGDGWYRKTFAASPAWSGKRVWLEVDAAGRVAEVWLNGSRLGEHRGAYARFRFDLTPRLAAGGDNVLALRVNNETNNIVPISGDFTMGGGLYRHVRLLVVDPVHLALNDLGSPGVYLTPQQVSAARAVIELKALVENDSSAAAAGQLVATVRDADGQVVARAQAAVSAAAGKSAEAHATLTLPKPHLWQGRSDPYLHRVRIELHREGRAVDAVEQPLGVRSFKFDPNQGFFLNGQSYPLYGVNRHPEMQDKGYAVSEVDHRRDYAIIEELGATTVRLCHYQHDDFEYSLCDQLGFVVWAENGFVNDALSGNADFEENACQQLREVIRQNYNHPSICWWSIGNETREKSAAVLHKLHAVARAEDTTRPTTYASDHDHGDARNGASDVLGFNKYFGWYKGVFDDLGPWLDEEHRQFPAKAIGMSEYGAGASIYQQEQHPATRSQGLWHPEQWQTSLHESAWLTLKARPYLWGVYIWVMFDFASDHRHEGDRDGINDKGLVTHDRLTRKDAFYWYQCNWAKAPMVHLTSARDVMRVAAKTEVKVYSNCDSVEVVLNGKSLGSKTSPDRRFIWPDVDLQPGPNQLLATAFKDGRPVATDSCGWVLTQGEAYHAPVKPAKKPAEKKPAQP